MNPRPTALKLKTRAKTSAASEVLAPAKEKERQLIERVIRGAQETVALLAAGYPAVQAAAEGEHGLESVRPKTMRLEPENEAGLVLLKEALGTPINKLVNVAVSEYVQRKSLALEANLTQALERVKAHRRADPTFAKDLQAFVSSEAKHGAKDPLEGETYDVTPPARKKASAKAAKAAKDQSALAKVRGILRG